jgi:hypothetical protein
MELKKAILLAKQKIANSGDDPGGVQEFSSGGVERLVICGVSWERYLALDKDRARVHAFATGVGGPWKSSS